MLGTIDATLCLNAVAVRMTVKSIACRPAMSVGGYVHDDSARVATPKSTCTTF